MSKSLQLEIETSKFHSAVCLGLDDNKKAQQMIQSIAEHYGKNALGEAFEKGMQQNVINQLGELLKCSFSIQVVGADRYDDNGYYQNEYESCTIKTTSGSLALHGDFEQVNSDIENSELLCKQIRSIGLEADPDLLQSIVELATELFEITEDDVEGKFTHTETKQ